MWEDDNNEQKENLMSWDEKNSLTHPQKWEKITFHNF